MSELSKRASDYGPGPCDMCGQYTASMRGVHRACAAYGRKRAHRRSLARLETIVGFSTMLRAQTPKLYAGAAVTTVPGSIIATVEMLKLESLGAAPEGAVARSVSDALKAVSR